MPTPTQLIQRLEAIGQSLANSGHALALLGLGSVGQERARLDAFSDLDFFAVVKTGYKQSFLDDLGWLSQPCPLAYAFMNTVDGYKALYEDGIFCEFAVFEPQEMAQISFAQGAIVWQHPDFDPQLALPKANSQRSSRTIEWLLGEALTNLYVGMGRFRRGEKLAAQRFIQHYAVDRVLELIAHIATETPYFADEFMMERRFERRYPDFESYLASFVAGYEQCPQSALAILRFLQAHFDVNQAIAHEIETLCAL